MSEGTRPVTLPPEVKEKLWKVRDLRHLTALKEGLLKTAFVLVAAALVAMTIDRILVLFDHRARLALTGTALLIVAIAFGRWVGRRFFSRDSLAEVALVVERSVPELEERWSTIAELSESSDPPEMLGASSLIDEIADQSSEIADLVSPEKIVSRKEMVRWSYILSGGLAVLLLAFLVSFQGTGILFLRFWLPWSNISATRVLSLTQDQAAAVGEPFTLAAKLEGRLRETATLIKRDSQGAQTTHLLHPDTDAPDRFSYRVRTVKEGFEYRFRSGDGETQWFHVAAVERPAITDVDLRILPPAYSLLPQEKFDTLPRRIRALEGSRLEVALRSSKPVARAVLNIDGQEPRSLEFGEENWLRYETLLEESFRFSPHLEDAHGLVNRFSPRCRIIVYTDRPPKVDIESPKKNLFVQADEKIMVRFEAEDDFGIAQAELVVEVQNENGEIEETIIPIPLGEQANEKKVRGRVALDLSQFSLKQGATVDYSIRVTDTRSAVGTAGPSMEEEGARPREESQQLASAKGRTDLSPPQDLKDPSENSPTDQPTTQEGSSTPAGRNAPPMKPGDPKETESGSTIEGAQQPPNDMSGRASPNKPPQTASAKMRLIIDEWANSFEGQMREKLQVDIEAYVKKLDEMWENAGIGVDDTREILRTTQRYIEREERTVKKSRLLLTQSKKTIAELREITDNTPFDFMGLQLHDIGVSSIDPARDLLSKAINRERPLTDNQADLTRASYHIGSARRDLANLTKEYDAVKRELDTTEALNRVAKMHQIFIEDSFSFLKNLAPTLNPRNPKMTAEVSEEVAKQIAEHYERMKELLAELAKAVRDNPNLNRRLMSLAQGQGMTLRDQLTLLAMRQDLLVEQIDGWDVTDREGRSEIKSKILESYREELGELAAMASELYDDTVTWMPEDSHLQDSFVSAVERSLQVALEAKEAERLLEVEGFESATLHSEKLLKRIADLQDAYTVADAMDEVFNNMDLVFGGENLPLPEVNNNRSLSVYISNRTAQSLELYDRFSGWIEKSIGVRSGSYGSAGAIDQSFLLADTLEFGDKMDRWAPTLAGLSSEIGAKTRDLVGTIKEDIAVEQAAAILAFKKGDLGEARHAEHRSATAFDEAEKTFDEILTLVEDTIAARPAPDSIPPPPDVEAMLAMWLKALETECEACEKLGAALMSNVMVSGDWFLPSSGFGGGGGGGIGSGSGSGSGSSAQMMAQMAAAQQLAQQSNNRIQDLAQQARRRLRGKRDRRSVQGEGGDQPGEPFPGSKAVELRNWNVFVSKLEKDLYQGRDTVPPEQYRRAIEAYFRNIGTALSELKSEN